MEEELKQWIEGQGWYDGYNYKDKWILPSQEQQEIYDSAYKEGVMCEQFEREEAAEDSCTYQNWDMDYSDYPTFEESGEE